MTLSAGTAIDTYEIVGQLGAGGMGEVYRARDRKLDRDVALKILPAEYSASAEHLRRFEQEARAASALNHPSIITIYEIGQSRDIAFIAMELVEGRDLRDLLAEGPMPLKQALRIAGRAAEGLAAAHERGIVHRDLKPENLMITTDGYVKVLDFGLAKLVHPLSPNDSTLPHTTPGAVFGTVGYMSPEQASGKATDYRSDQFSFGVILFEMLVRRRPFDRNTAPETLTAIIREEHPRLRDIDAALPPELERIVDRLLRKDPADRYASTRDLARDLREVRDALTNPSGRRSGSHAAPGLKKRGRIAAIAAAAVAAVAGIAYMTMHPPTPTTTPPRFRSVAVLPFRDMSPSKDAQTFTDGLSEMITTRLAKSKSIRVVSPFGGAEIPETATLKEIAERRGADIVLRGGVQRTNNELRVTYALLDPNGTQLGGDTITASTADLFAAEDMVAESILRQLGAAPDTAAQPRHDSLESPDDQKQYVEAVGLMRRIKGPATTQQAVRQLEALLVKARDSALVNAALARALVLHYDQTKNAAFAEQANIYATRAASIDASLPDVHVTLGDVRRIGGKFEEARAEYEKAAALRANYPEALLGLAETYDKLGRSAPAEHYYSETIRIAPDWPSAYAKFGGYWFNRGQSDKAVANFRRMAELMPDSPRGYSNLGAVYFATAKYDDAIAAFEHAILIDPKYATGYSNLGSCHYFVGKFAEAASDFEHATSLRPDNYLLWANLGDARRWDGANAKLTRDAYETAVSKARNALAVNANDALVHAVIASSLAKLGRHDDAKREADRALSIDPTNYDALYHAAVAAHLRGDDAAAIAWLGRAVRAGYSPSNAEHDPEWKSLRSRTDFRDALKPS